MDGAQPVPVTERSPTRVLARGCAVVGPWLLLILGQSCVGELRATDEPTGRCSVVPDPVAAGDPFEVTVGGLEDDRPYRVDVGDEGHMTTFIVTANGAGRARFSASVTSAGSATVSVSSLAPGGLVQARCSFAVSACEPATCAMRSAECGAAPDGCGGNLACGTCPSSEVCGGGGIPNRCGLGDCTPRTCASAGAECGSISDGCGRMLECGGCGDGEVCGGGGEANVCACAPTSCAGELAECGTIADGCGGMLDCGTCTAPETCGGDGLSNHCAVGACVPATCAELGAECDTVSDGCGGTLDCGPCGGCTAATCPWGCVADVCDGPVSLGAGAAYGCAVRVMGTAVCWGANEWAQLGDGSQTERPIPTPVSGLTNVVAIAAGELHTCALIGDGTARCWGHDGDGPVLALTPVVIAGVAEAIAVAVGWGHMCALRADGTVLCWGWNTNGQVGDGTASGAYTVPPAVVAGASDVVQIATGQRHTCAVTAAGAVLCWGANEDGQLGDGTAGVDRLSPVAVSGLADATSVVAGARHTCAIRRTGAVACWGAPFGPSPVVVVGAEGASQLSAGAEHTCGLRADGSAVCWGANAQGQLGDGTTTARPFTPGPVAGVTDAVELSAGAQHTCALLHGSEILCWGANDHHQLGDRTIVPSSTPVPLMPP